MIQSVKKEYLFLIILLFITILFIKYPYYKEFIDIFLIIIIFSIFIYLLIDYLYLRHDKK